MGLHRKPNNDLTGLTYQVERLKTDNAEFLSKCMGIVQTELICQHCYYKSKTYEPFLTLSLSIEKEAVIKLNLYLIMGSNFTEPKDIEIDVKISGRDNLKLFAEQLAR